MKQVVPLKQKRKEGDDDQRLVDLSGMVGETTPVDTQKEVREIPLMHSLINLGKRFFTSTGRSLARAEKKAKRIRQEDGEKSSEEKDQMKRAEQGDNHPGISFLRFKNRGREI